MERVPLKQTDRHHKSPGGDLCIRDSGGGEVRLDVSLIRRASVASGKCTGPLSDAARPPYPIYTPHISLPNLRPISHYPLTDL
ncbi:hypothetical protein EA221_23995 [Escherichia coli]|nr:hypothetical protein EA221_23995 [Escherichia coli]